MTTIEHFMPTTRSVHFGQCHIINLLPSVTNGQVAMKLVGIHVLHTAGSVGFPSVAAHGKCSTPLGHLWNSNGLYDQSTLYLMCMKMYYFRVLDVLRCSRQMTGTVYYSSAEVDTLVKIKMFQIDHRLSAFCHLVISKTFFFCLRRFNVPFFD